MGSKPSLSRSGRASEKRGHGCLVVVDESIDSSCGLEVSQHPVYPSDLFDYHEPSGEDAVIQQHESIEQTRIGLQTARRNEWVTIIDATVESGLVDAWLAEQLSSQADVRWAEASPRRPRIHHNGPLKDDTHPFVVASGRVVDILDLPLDEANIDTIVATALENDISALTIRCGLDLCASTSFTRKHRSTTSCNRQGRRKAFLTRHTTSNHLLLCVQYPQNSDT